MSCPEYGPTARQALLRDARRAIEFGLENAGQFDVDALIDLEGLQPQLLEYRASFITLTKFDVLCGCTGSLEPRRALIEDVTENACHTAFYDARFPGVSHQELGDLRIEISVLSPLQVMQVSSEEDLLSQLNTSMGLMIEDGSQRGTFLPKVWESLPDPAQFLAELKIKAGISKRRWSSAIRVYSYHTESFAEAS